MYHIKFNATGEFDGFWSEAWGDEFPPRSKHPPTVGQTFNRLDLQTVYTWDGTAWVAAAAGAGIVVQEEDGAPSVAAADLLIFDQADGFVITDLGGGDVRVDLAAVPESVLALNFPTHPVIAISAAGASISAGTAVFSNSGGVSFGMAGSTITATVQTNYQSQGAYLTTAALSNHSHGNPQLNLTNLSGTTASNSAGFTLSLSAGVGGAGDGGNILAAGTRTAHSLSTVLFSNLNGLTFGLEAVAGSVMTASYTVPTQTAFVLSNSNGISFGTNGSTVTATVQTNYLTTAMASNRGSDFVQATAAFAGTNASGTIASGGISVSVGNYITTAMASNRGSDFVQAAAAFAGTNASGTIASGGISVSVAAPGGGGGNAIAADTRTAGAGSTVLFSNANGLTFGLNAVAGSIMTASHNALTTAMASNRGSDFVQATAAFAGTNASGTIASGGISISVAAPGGGAGFTRSRFNPFMEAVGVAGQIGQGTLHFHPIPDPEAFQCDRMLMDVLYSNATNSTGSATMSLWAGLYTRNVSTLSLYASASTSQGFTHSGTVRASLMAGPRVFSMGWTTTIPQNDYWLGLVTRTTTGGGNATISQYVASDVNSNFSGVLGAASNATAQNVLGLGIYTATTSAMPASVAFSQIQGTASQFLRVPLYYFLSQTA